MKQLLSTLLCLLASALGACQQKGEFRSRTVDEFAEAIALPDVQRLDVRTVAEYSEGHIPGSLNLNVLDERNFTALADSVLDKTRPVALYCRSGKRSKRAATLLSQQGYKVVELATGFNGWIAAGRETEK